MSALFLALEARVRQFQAEGTTTRREMLRHGDPTLEPAGGAEVHRL